MRFYPSILRKKKIDVNSERVERAIDKAYDSFEKKDMPREQFRAEVKGHIDRTQRRK